MGWVINYDIIPSYVGERGEMGVREWIRPEDLFDSRLQSYHLAFYKRKAIPINYQFHLYLFLFLLFVFFNYVKAIHVDSCLVFLIHIT